MLKHIFKGLAISLAVVFVMTLAAVPVMAADFRAENTVTVSSGEVVDDDLYTAGNNVIIDGTVNGDLWVAGDTVVVNGTVKGSMVAVGQTVTINGEVAHTARIAGETLNVAGNINGDLLAFGGTVNVDRAAKISGDLIMWAGNSRIDGHIGRDIKGGGGNITVTNGVGGDIELQVDKLVITSTASVQGDLTYTSENEAEIQSGAVGGTTTHNIPEVKEPDKAGPFAGITGKLIGFLMALVTGIIIILVAHRRITSMASSIQNNPWQSLGWGALILFVTPVAAIIVCITVIGLPLGLISLALYGIAIYLSLIPVALLIGRLIIGRFTEADSKGILIGALAAGLAILAILRLIPFLGFFIGLATILFGMGSVVASEIRLRAESP